MSDFSLRRVAGLDLVRSVAIMSVVVGHYWPLYERFPALGPLKFSGVLGVEIFFVLSGFLIGGILLRQAADLANSGRQFNVGYAPDFWVRRWFRTLPNYLLFFGIFLVYHAPWETGDWKPWLLSIFFLQNLFTDLSSGTFGVAWSLCVEEWMYLLLPLVLAVATRIAADPRRAALGASLGLISISTLLRCTTAGQLWDLGVRHVVIYRLDAIAYGVLLAWISRYHGDLFSRLCQIRWAILGLTTIAAIWVHFVLAGELWVTANVPLKGMRWFVMHVLFFPAISLAVMPIVAWSSRLETIPSLLGPIAYRTSLYSYSMYLSHTLVFYWTSTKFSNFIRVNWGDFRGLTFVMILVTLSVLYVTSALIYHAWEAPLTRLRERFSTRVENSRQHA